MCVPACTHIHTYTKAQYSFSDRISVMLYKFPPGETLFFFFSRTHYAQVNTHTHGERMPSLCTAKELLQTKIRENTSIYVPLRFYLLSRSAQGWQGLQTLSSSFSTPEPAPP